MEFEVWCAVGSIIMKGVELEMNGGRKPMLPFLTSMCILDVVFNLSFLWAFGCPSPQSRQVHELLATKTETRTSSFQTPLLEKVLTGSLQRTMCVDITPSPPSSYLLVPSVCASINLKSKQSKILVSLTCMVV